MKNLFTTNPSRKPHIFYLNSKVNNVLAVEKGMLRIAEHFQFNLNDTEQLHDCKHIFDQVLVCCQILKKRYDKKEEFEQAFQLFRKSHTFN